MGSTSQLKCPPPSLQLASGKSLPQTVMMLVPCVDTRTGKDIGIPCRHTVAFVYLHAIYFLYAKAIPGSEVFKIVEKWLKGRRRSDSAI